MTLALDAGAAIGGFRSHNAAPGPFLPTRCLGEFGEGAGEFRLMRQRSDCAPTAVLPQGLIDLQAGDEVAGGRRFRIALAMKAVASAARSFAGRPVAARRADNKRPRGAREIAEASNCICPPSGPVT